MKTAGYPQGCGQTKISKKVEFIATELDEIGLSSELASHFQNKFLISIFTVRSSKELHKK